MLALTCSLSLLMEKIVASRFSLTHSPVFWNFLYRLTFFVFCTFSTSTSSNKRLLNFVKTSRSVSNSEIYLLFQPPFPQVFMSMLVANSSPISSHLLITVQTQLKFNALPVNALTHPASRKNQF